MGYPGWIDAACLPGAVGLVILAIKVDGWARVAAFVGVAGIWFLAALRRFRAYRRDKGDGGRGETDAGL